MEIQKFDILGEKEHGISIWKITKIKGYHWDLSDRTKNWDEEL
jgi:hypothetical protein